jgi:hypothetical protein
VPSAEVTVCLEVGRLCRRSLTLGCLTLVVEVSLAIAWAKARQAHGRNVRMEALGAARRRLLGASKEEVGLYYRSGDPEC